LVVGTTLLFGSTMAPV